MTELPHEDIHYVLESHLGGVGEDVFHAVLGLGDGQLPALGVRRQGEDALQTERGGF